MTMSYFYYLKFLTELLLNPRGHLAYIDLAFTQLGTSLQPQTWIATKSIPKN